MVALGRGTPEHHLPIPTTTSGENEEDSWGHFANIDEPGSPFYHSHHHHHRHRNGFFGRHHEPATKKRGLLDYDE